MELPLYLDVEPSGALEGPVITGFGESPSQALENLTSRLERDLVMRGVPSHALYLNTSRLATLEPEGLARLLLVDPFLHAIYHMGRQHGILVAESRVE